MSRINSERGVAMITVVLVGAALTATASVGTFATIQEFRQGRVDRSGSQALAYAEAGIDRFMQYLKSGLVNYAQLNRAGCGSPPIALPTGTIGAGTFSAQLTVYNPSATGEAQHPPSACVGRPTKPHPGQDGSDNTFFVITSTGCSSVAVPCAPNAARVVRQVVAVRPVGLPVGLYGHAIDPKANPTYSNISAVSETYFNDRGKNDFVGTDSYYLYNDFFPGNTNGVDPNARIPAGVHAGTGIYLKKSGNPEFTGGPNGTKNCTANPTPSNQNSLWDSDGSAGAGTITSDCSGNAGGAYPRSSVFSPSQLPAFQRPTLTEQEYQTLKDAAKQYGVYCNLPGAGVTGVTGSCVRAGVPQTGTAYNTYVQNVLATRNQFVVYVDFQGGSPTANNMLWSGSVWGCDSANPNNTKSVVIIVRNGGWDDTGAGGDQINGAMLVDGDVKADGALTFQGSIVAKGTISFGSSSQTVQLSDCWVNQMPGPFFSVVPGHWSVVDR